MSTSYVGNTTSLQLVEVSFATEGRHRNPVQRTLPIACYRVTDDVAQPVTVVPRREDAHYFVYDPVRKVWWDKDGREWGTWAELMRPIYASDAREHVPEPTQEPVREPLTTPSIGGVGMWDAPPRSWKP